MTSSMQPDNAPVSRKTAIPRSQRWWALALLPAAVIALGASSYRYMEIYQPNTFSAGQQAQQEQVLQFRSTVDSEAGTYPVNADFQIVGSTPVDAAKLPMAHPLPGTTMWAVKFHVSAPEDSVLTACRASLFDAAGTEYVYNPSMLGIDPANDQLRFNPLFACVPNDAPGPLPPTALDFADTASPQQRPAEYDKTLLFVLPDGVEPTSLRLAWFPPDYAQLELPAPDTNAVFG